MPFQFQLNWTDQYHCNLFIKSVLIDVWLSFEDMAVSPLGAAPPRLHLRSTMSPNQSEQSGLVIKSHRLKWECSSHSLDSLKQLLIKMFHVFASFYRTVPWISCWTDFQIFFKVSIAKTMSRYVCFPCCHAVQEVCALDVFFNLALCFNFQNFHIYTINIQVVLLQSFSSMCSGVVQ